MRRSSTLMMIIMLMSSSIMAQDYNITRNGNSVSASGSVNGVGGSSSISLSRPDRSSSSTNSYDSYRDRDYRDYNKSENVGLDLDQSWGISDSRINEVKTIRLENKRSEKMIANSVYGEMVKLYRSDCIDVVLIKNVLEKYNNLSQYQKSYLGDAGHNSRAYLLSQLSKAEPLYIKYSCMAMNIKNNSFSSLDKETMLKPYESQSVYLKQFINKDDFDQARSEYRKYEKAKVFETEISRMYSDINNKKNLRENYVNVLKMKPIIEKQDALKYVNKRSLYQIVQVEKVLQYDEIKKIPLTVSNINTKLRSMDAIKNNAEWNKISQGMTSQVLLSVLGLLNTDNDNILPYYVDEKDGYYHFIGTPIDSDTKTVAKEYLVAKDGSKVEIYETEVVVTNDLVNVKSKIESDKIKISGESKETDESSITDYSFSYNVMNFKVSVLNTDWHKKSKQNICKILSDGTIIQYGAESSFGVQTGIYASANASILSDETNNLNAETSFGADAEVAHIGATIASKKIPVMHIGRGNAVSFRQLSTKIDGDLTAGGRAKLKLSNDGISGKVGAAASVGVSVSSQNIDGALKQIDSDVVLEIINSSLNDGYYEGDYKYDINLQNKVRSIKREIESVKLNQLINK